MVYRVVVGGESIVGAISTFIDESPGMNLYSARA